MLMDSEIGNIAAIGPAGHPPCSKYERLIARREAGSGGDHDRRSSLRRDLAARCRSKRRKPASSFRSWSDRRQDCGRGARAQARHQPLRDRRRAAQRGGSGKGRRADPRGQRRAADEGQPAYRRADARRHLGQDRAAHRAPDQPCLHHGCADLSGDAVHHRCGDQYLSRSRCQARHRPERDRSVHPGRPRHAAGRDPVRRRDGDAENSVDHRRGRAVQDGRARPDHRRHARRPARLRQRHRSRSGKIKGIKSEVAGRAQILVVPDLEAGNMLAKNSTSWPRRTRPESCSARACRSFSPRARIRCARAWRPVRSRCSTPMPAEAPPLPAA